MSNEKATITVIRHGETQWNKLGYHQGVLNSPLNEKGLEQAKQVAQTLQKFTYRKLYSSDLGRAVQTAQIIAAALKMDVILDSRLQERNLGCLGGLTLDEFRKKYPEECAKFLSEDPDYILPGGESVKQAYKRSIACFEELAARHRGESILIVTHGYILEYLFRHALGIPLQQKRRYVLKNCSVSRFIKLENEWKLDAWGAMDASETRVNFGKAIDN